MQCPTCGTEMEATKEAYKRMFKGKEIELEYTVYTCPKCKESYIDAYSLQNSWKEAWRCYKDGC